MAAAKKKASVSGPKKKSAPPKKAAPKKSEPKSEEAKAPSAPAPAPASGLPVPSLGAKRIVRGSERIAARRKRLAKG